MNTIEETINKNVIYPEGYKQHYKDTKYFLNYYHKNKHLIECPNCHKQTRNTHINEHQRSKKCINYFEEKEERAKLNTVVNLDDEKELKLLQRRINQVKYQKKKNEAITH